MDRTFTFPSEEWAEEYCKRLSGSVEYRNAAKTWEGPILFVCKGLPEDLKGKFGGRDKVGFELDLYRGECRGSRWFLEPEKSNAPFVIEATYEDWLKVIRGELGPIPALMSGKLKVTRGSLATLMRYASAALIMVRKAKEIPTDIQI